MAPKNKQFSIYPEPTALAVVGGNCAGCNRAIGCWAATLQQPENEPKLTRPEWNFLADVLNGTWLLDADHWGPGTLAAEIEDAHRLNRTGDKWFRPGKVADKAIAKLIAAVRAMTWIQIQFILTAVSFFWSAKEIDHTTDEWWTLPYRVERLGRGEVED
jgi:hypothetical protein